MHSDAICRGRRWTRLTKAEQEEWLGEGGRSRGQNGLKPSSAATTVRTTNGKLQVLDGPNADSKEQFKVKPFSADHQFLFNSPDPGEEACVN